MARSGQNRTSTETSGYLEGDMANKVCPICKGERFIKVKQSNEHGYEYEFYKRCECLTNGLTENPFEGKEGDRNETRT